MLELLLLALFVIGLGAVLVEIINHLAPQLGEDLWHPSQRQVAEAWAGHIAAAHGVPQGQQRFLRRARAGR